MGVGSVLIAFVLVAGFLLGGSVPLYPMTNTTTPSHESAIRQQNHYDKGEVKHLQFYHHTVGYIQHGAVHIYDGTWHRISKGEIYFLRAGWHTVRYMPDGDTPCKEIVVNLSHNTTISILHTLETCGAISPDAPHPTSAPYAHQSASPALAAYFKGLSKYLSQQVLDNVAIIEHLKIGELFCLLFSSPTSSVANNLRHIATLHESDFEEQIRSHIFTNITIPQLAQKCSMCPSTFKAVFRRHYGCSPHHWFVAQRMDSVCSALRYTNSPIKNIAQEYGFASPSHLIRLFKANYGVTPTQYRAQNHTLPNTPSAVNLINSRHLLLK